MKSLAVSLTNLMMDKKNSLVYIEKIRGRVWKNNIRMGTPPPAWTREIPEGFAGFVVFNGNTLIAYGVPENIDPDTVPQRKPKKKKRESMADKAWKAAERKVCQDLGGKRRGASYVNDDGDDGTNDCVQTGKWSVEVKLLKTIPWSIVVQNALNAVARKRPGQVGIGIIKRNGDKWDRALVCIPYKEFLEHFTDNEDERN